MPVDFGRSYRLGGGPHFVIEGDEYDCAFFDKRPKFVHYLPNVAIIGNVEFDHADIYPDLAAVQLAFVRLMNVVPAQRAAHRRAPRARRSSRSCRRRAAGSRRSACTRGPTGGRRTCETGPDGSRFRLVRQGRDEGEFALPMGGRAQRPQRAGGPGGRGRGGGRARGRPARRSAAFQGVKRRLEVRGEAGGVTVYDDFAHHPTAVAATLAALRALGGSGRLVAVFEPRSYTAKTRVFQADFARAFAGADRVIVAAAHLPGKVPEGQRLSEAELVAGSAGRARTPSSSRRVDEIVRALVAEVRPGDRVAILSNGGFGGIHDKLLRALEAAART